MQDILRIALASMQQDADRLDRIAINLANLTTPGFKREVVASRPFADLVDPTSAAGGVEQGQGTAIQIDSRNGTVKETGEPFDVALTSNGFFEVSTDAGPAYTRRGNFHADARGRLITAEGYPVMGTGGEIYLTTPTPVIDASGMVTEPNATTGPAAGAPNAPVAQLKIVQADHPARMEDIGDGVFLVASGMTEMNRAEVQMRQGALENSNVNPVSEMTALLRGNRHFESIQKLVQNYDDMIGTAIQKLGGLS
jgi:flagellar basal-body rod protein FlgG